MALPASGILTIEDIANEFGGVVPHDLSEYYGADTGVPTTGELAISDFYGTSSTNAVESMSGSDWTFTGDLSSATQTATSRRYWGPADAPFVSGAPNTPKVYIAKTVGETSNGTSLTPSIDTTNRPLEYDDTNFSLLFFPGHRGEDLVSISAHFPVQKLRVGDYDYSVNIRVPAVVNDFYDSDSSSSIRLYIEVYDTWVDDGANSYLTNQLSSTRIVNIQGNQDGVFGTGYTGTITVSGQYVNLRCVLSSGLADPSGALGFRNFGMTKAT